MTPASHTPDAFERLSFVAALGAAALIICLLAMPLFLGQVYKHDDLSRYHLPYRYFYAKSLSAGENFTWIPHVFCGFYLHGEGQVGMFHPLHLILYRILPLGVAFNLELLLSYPFMFAGLFLFLRRWKIAPAASALGAFVFTFSGFNLLHYMHMNAIAVAAHIPWLLLAIDVSLRDEGRRAALAAWSVSLLTTSQLLLGHPTTFWLSSLAELGYAMLLAPSWSGRGRVVSLGTAKALGVLGGCIQLLPHWDATLDSTRAHLSLASRMWPSLHPVHLLQLVAPYFFNDLAFEGIPYELKPYIGAIPLALLPLLLVRRKKLGALRPLATGCLCMGVFSLVLALGKYGYLYRLQTSLPLVGLLRTPCRYVLLFHLAMAVAAAIAFGDILTILRDRNRLGWGQLWPLSLIPLVGALPFAFRLFAGSAPPMPAWYFTAGIAPTKQTLAGPLILALGTVLVLATLRGRQYAVVGLVLFAAVDQGLYGMSYIWQNEPGAKVRLFKDFAPTPPEPSRFRVHSTNNVWIMKDVRIDGGYASIPPEKHLRGESESELRVKSVHWIWDRGKQTMYALTGRVIGWELPRPLPRARLVTKARVSSHPRTNIHETDIESTAIVSIEVNLQGGEPGEASITEEHPGEIVVVTKADSTQLLVLSESYHEGWRALLDGKRRPVLQVYGDFLGCVVEAGTHEVKFTFRPRSLRVGGWLSALGIGLASGWFLVSLVVTAWRRDTLQGNSR